MELFDTQALLCLVSITDHLKSYTWQSTTVNPVGEGNCLDYIKRPCLKGKKKKKSKTNCFKTFKTSRHFLCKGVDSEMGSHSAQEATFLPCTPQHLPHPTQTNPIPSAQALKWKRGLLLWSMVTGRGLWRRGHRGHAVRLRTAQQCCPVSRVWSWLNKPYF